MTDPPAPLQIPGTVEASAERLVSLDYIRGVAVLGILLANIVVFAQPRIANGWPGGLTARMNSADTAVWAFEYLFIDGKMRGLFTVLFGAGMWLFVERARTRGATRALQARRLGWLAIFGLAHFFLLFRGDILFPYAVWGFAALFAMEWRAKTMLHIGIGLYLLGAALDTAVYAPSAMLERTGPRTDPIEQEHYSELIDLRDAALRRGNAQRVLFRQGSFTEIVADTMTNEAHRPFATIWSVMLETFPLILIGMALLRQGWFHHGRPSGQIKWGLAGIALGTVLTVPLVWLTWRSGYAYWFSHFLFAGPMMAARLPMIFGMVVVLAAVAPAASRGWLGERLVAAGRMAFTNYIATSAVMMLVFQGWAGGLFGTLGRTGMLAAVALGWALMLGWSAPWLARYRYGPLEWLWRCLTYWQIFPLRR